MIYSILLGFLIDDRINVVVFLDSKHSQPRLSTDDDDFQRELTEKTLVWKKDTRALEPLFQEFDDKGKSSNSRVNS